MAIIRTSEKTERFSFTYPKGVNEEYDNLVTIADDHTQCWYCGGKADGIIKCRLTIKRFYEGINKRKNVDRTFPFDVHICKDCLLRHEEMEKKESTYARIGLIFGLVFAVFFSIYGPFLIIGRIIIGLILGFFVSWLFGELLSRIFRKKSHNDIRSHECRTIEEHPFIFAMQLYENNIQSKDEFRLTLNRLKDIDIDEGFDRFREYKKNNSI